MDDSSNPPHTALKDWLALLHAPGLGSRNFNRLLEAGETPTQLIAEPHRAQTIKLPGCDLCRYLQSPDWESVERDLTWLDQPNCHIIPLGSPDYPSLLSSIDDPPALLFVHGAPDRLTLPQLAMVGSRNPSASGRQTAQEFAHHLGQAGLTITSGLATGIDAAGHQGALEAGAATIAVTGTGLDRVYPARHRDLAHQIAEQGALVSEFPPGTPPRPGHFPRRNRIISGLSVGTLVVEAAKKSGSLITARTAMEQGREVFAIPGSIHNPLVRGCHALIRQGAKLVETADDIIEELGALFGALERPTTQETGQTDHETPQWDTDYQRLFKHLGFDPTPVDLLIQRSGLTAEAVSSMLILLELDGYVSPAPGRRYVLTGKTTDQ
ncbi:MAG: DNA-processing protein DprA [Chromatiales bacterium]|nr:DNA-processing protein DprA [Chromatiales bacterium]